MRVDGGRIVQLREARSGRAAANGSEPHFLLWLLAAFTSCTTRARTVAPDSSYNRIGGERIRGQRDRRQGCDVTQPRTPNRRVPARHGRQYRRAMLNAP